MRCGTSEDDVIDVDAIADGLVYDPAGYWTAPSTEAVSYPAEDSDVCFGIEETSLVRARNRVITAVAERFQPRGAMVDVGGGNGFVAKALTDRGHDVVLVEPSPRWGGACGEPRPLPCGPRHARGGAIPCRDLRRRGTVGCGRAHRRRRGVPSLPSAAFTSDAPVYVTVPAYQSLWSVDDDAAGHFRRYRRGTLRAVFAAAGFDVVFSTYFFAPFPLPILLLRALPSRFGMRRRSTRPIAREHRPRIRRTAAPAASRR